MKLCETKINKGVLARLASLNIYTVAELKKIGATKAYILMLEHSDKNLPRCYNLYDPAAIIMGLNTWRDLSRSQKEKLDEEIISSQK